MGAVVGAGGVVAGGGVVAAGGAVGAAVVAAGVAVGVAAGVSVGGAEVGAVVTRTVAVADADAEALALGDELEDVGRTCTRWFPRKRNRTTRTVTRLPATAASRRSIGRGPRRGGGMILVVSLDGVWSVMTPP